MQLTPGPPYRDALRYPFTLQVAIGAIVISLNWWMGGQWARPLIASDSLVSKPWTVLTSTLPHVNFIHLLFNLSWWWPFGSRVERVWGTGHAVLIFVFLAVLSMGAEFALFEGGVGLSGVVYGLCTLIWVVQDRIPGFEQTVTKQTLQLFLVWFAICIVLTVTKVAPIGNAAHGAGALAGWVLGKFIVGGRSRSAWGASLVAMTALVALGATVGRPWVNLSSATSQHGREGLTALSDGRYEEAVQLLEGAEQASPKDTSVLMYLGIAYQHVNRHHDAVTVYKRALSLDADKREDIAPLIAEALDHEAAQVVEQGNLNAARKLARESLQWAPDGQYARDLLKWINASQSPTTGESFDTP